MQILIFVVPAFGHHLQSTIMLVFNEQGVKTRLSLVGNGVRSVHL